MARSKKTKPSVHPVAGKLLPPRDTVPADAAEKQFVRGVVIRGEAASPGADGKLPPGATHEIVGTDAEGEPVIERRRFKIA
jgi:hypothetical protein